MSKTRQRRRRGVILTLEGLQSLEQARARTEYENNFRKRYTFEKLSELTDLDIHTVKRILNAKKGVDKRSLELFFMAFGLKLTEEHYKQPNPYTRQHWGEAISVSDFLGRTQELTTLKQWLLKDRCRLVTILGIGGVGKTSLSIKLAQQIQERFDCVIWRSLRDAPPLEELLADIIQFLSEEQVTETELPESISGKISCLIDCLRSSRCLIILDNLESLLLSNSQAGLFREGYEEHNELIRRLGETEHQSCLLFTSREKPKSVAALEGQTLPIRTFILKGLREKEAEYILRLKGINGSHTELSDLVQHYEGNILALKVVATTIWDLFKGKIAEFLREDISVFGDIRNLLDQQFQRLSDSEQEIIYWLGINREPTTLSQLREDMIPTIPRLNLIEGLESLSRRSLIERNESGFTLQSVVMEYVVVRLIEKVIQEFKTQKLQFVRCYALMKATAKDYVRETQIRLILQPIINELFTIFKCQNNIEERLTEILATQRNLSPREPGYIAGNIINLFCKMETDLTGYDFSNLCVWEADLRNASLHNVNFAHADLSKSLFAEAFGGIWSVVYSLDGSIVAFGDTKGEIFFRRAFDDQPIRSFKGHKGWVVSLDFSPDGKTLASSSCDCTAKLWDVETGNCLHTLWEHEHEVWSVAFSPNGETLATGCDDNKARLWDVKTGECLKVFQGHTDYVLSVVFNANGTHILSGSHDNTIKLWDIKTGECKKIFQGHNDGVRSLAISPDSETFASSSNDRTIRLWHMATGRCLRVLQGHLSMVSSVVFLSSGNLLASSSNDQTIRLWDIETGRCFRVLQGHYNHINSVAFNSQTNILASGSYDQTVRLWNIHTYQCVKTFKGYSNQVLSLVSSVDAQTLASGGNDQKLRLWNVETGKVLKTFHEHTNWIWSIAFSPQGNFIASASGDKTIKLWDVALGKAIKTFHGHQAIVRSVAFSSDNQTLASGSEDKTVRLWNVNSDRTVRILQGHQAEIWSVSFSPNGQILASGSLDGTAKLWDTNTGKCFKTLKEHMSWVWSVAFSPDNKTLATTSPDQTIRLYDIETSKCKSVLREDTGCSLLVTFNPNGQIMASCNQKHIIKLWNLDTEKCFNVLQGHKALINSVIFSSDNQTLFSSSEDETIKIWNIKSGECIKTLRSKKPYEDVNIAEVHGLSEANINTLKLLGAIEGSVAKKIKV